VDALLVRNIALKAKKVSARANSLEAASSFAIELEEHTWQDNGRQLTHNRVSHSTPV
jgi:hypothetical protein